MASVWVGILQIVLMSFDPLILQSGDVLLYRPSSLFGHIITVKTWSRVSHVEIYIGQDQAVGSREKTGVRIYPLRTDDLGFVLRSKPVLDQDTAMLWFFAKANGQKYDYLGLLCFTLAVAQGSPRKQFCSEFATRFLRHGGVSVVANHWDADKVAPGTFLMSPMMEIVWSDGKPM